MRKILLIDAHLTDGRIMCSLLEKAGYEPLLVKSINAGVKMAGELSSGSVIVSAKKLPDGDVVELINRLKAEKYNFPVLAIVDVMGSGQDIREIMRNHYVIDVIQRPAIDKELVDRVNQYSNSYDGQNVVHFNELLPNTSKTWKAIEKKIDSIASTNENVVIFGECGTGKEQIAMEIFYRSPRADKPLKVLAAGAAALVERVKPDDEYHDTYHRIRSYFNEAIGGTLIIKSIENLTHDKQEVLLHILKEERPDVRLICTASSKLLELTEDGDFKRNLFFILRATNIQTPSLRDMTDEIKSIAEFFIRQDAEERNLPVKKVSSEALKELRKLDWPGNLRELKHMVLMAAWTCEGDCIYAKDLDLDMCEPNSCTSEKLHCPMEERRKIVSALRKYSSKVQAAEVLGISRGKLDRLIKKYGIDDDDIQGNNSLDCDDDLSLSDSPEDTPVDN